MQRLVSLVGHLDYLNASAIIYSLGQITEFPNLKTGMLARLPPHLILRPIATAVLENIIELLKKLGFKTPGAIHLATGMLAGCDLFVTGDQARNKSGVTVVAPADVG